MVIAGSTANGYGGGYISGHDAKNGEELWRKEVIPHPGEPGDETWPAHASRTAGTPESGPYHL